jgi:PPOX class probable F420-dependent enzyme
MNPRQPDSLDLPPTGTAMLTTFRRSGQAVATPVSLVVDGGRLYFATPADSGKAKRLARNDHVMVAPCTPSGRVTGQTISGRARPYRPARRARRRWLLRPTRAMFWSALSFRLRGKPVQLFEITTVVGVERRHPAPPVERQRSASASIPTSSHGGAEALGTPLADRVAHP